MARTNIPLSELVPNDELADPAGTAADDDGHVVNPLADWPNATLEEIVLRVVVASAGDAANVTVLAGANPPALEAGVGDLEVECDDDATTWIGPFTSARFAQSDGTLHIDIDDETGVTITAFHVPRTA